MSIHAKMKLVSLASAAGGRQLDEYEIDRISIYVDEAVEAAKAPNPVYCDWRILSELLKEMAVGQKKIECIKLYRQLTGVGLKEAKDEVEKYIYQSR